MIPNVSLSASGLVLSRIGLGLAGLHHLRSERDRTQLIGEALELGITHFDTAKLYGDGVAERSLGIATCGRRDGLTIATKFGLHPSRLIRAMPALSIPLRVGRSLARRAGLTRGPRRSWRADAFRASLASSLRALKTEYVDILFLHDVEPQELMDRDDLMRALEDARCAGEVRFLGLATSCASVSAILADRPGIFDVIQVPERQWDEQDLVPDITFGAMASGPQEMGNKRTDSAQALKRLAQALARRQNGAVLVGTTNPGHLKQLVSVATA